MKNKLLSSILILTIAAIIIPSVALAAWWNPFTWNWNIFSWFLKPQTTIVQQNQNNHPASSNSAIAQQLISGWLNKYESSVVVDSERISNYKINSITIAKTESNCFGFNVDFSVQTYLGSNSSWWLAGNGKTGSDNWINNKSLAINALEQNSVYKIIGAGTAFGPGSCSVPDASFTGEPDKKQQTNQNLTDSLLNNTKYGYQFYYDPKVFKVMLVGTKIEPTDYREVHIDVINPPNPGNPAETCYGGNYVSEQDFLLINLSSATTSNLPNQSGLSVKKTVKTGQQSRALNLGEVNNSTLTLILYNISDGSKSFNIAFGCQGSLINDQDRTKYRLMSKAQDDVWLKSIEDKLDQTISTFKFTNLNIQNGNQAQSLNFTSSVTDKDFNSMGKQSTKSVEIKNILLPINSQEKACGMVTQASKQVLGYDYTHQCVAVDKGSYWEFTDKLTCPPQALSCGGTISGDIDKNSGNINNFESAILQ